MEIRKRYPLPNIIFILSLSLICIFYFVYFHNLIPYKFYFDSGTIFSAMKAPSSVDLSYRNVSILFKLLGINNSNWNGGYIHLLSWIIFQLFLLITLRINKNKIFSTTQVLFISFIAIMYGIYFNSLSKDLILILFLLIILNFYINNDNFNYLLFFIGLYTIFFRRYWIILFIFSLFIQIIKKNRIKKIIFYIIFLFIITIIIYDLFNGNFITNTRVQENVVRLNSPNTGSMIYNIFPNTSMISDIINYIYILITLMCPIQGIPSSNTIIYYIWIASLIILIVKYRNNLNKKLLLLLFVYINMQTLFEPDFGSIFRHQLALFPLIYYLLNEVKIKEGVN